MMICDYLNNDDQVIIVETEWMDLSYMGCCAVCGGEEGKEHSFCNVSE